MIVGLVLMSFAVPPLIKRWLHPPLPGAAAQQSQLEHESIGRFTPPGAHLVNKWSKGAARDTTGFEGPGEYPTTVGRNFTLEGPRGAAMRAYVAPALHDGWKLASVSCSTTLGTSTISFVKQDAFGEKLVVKTERSDHALSAVLTVPLDENGVADTSGTGGSAPRELLDTGVSRTDPGCLDSGAPAPQSGPRPNWSGSQVCALLDKAWPQATNLQPEGDSCWTGVEGVGLSIAPVSPSSRAFYLDKRLSPAGDNNGFALVGGGFWVLRPDVAFVATPLNTDPADVTRKALTESSGLALAKELQQAP